MTIDRFFAELKRRNVYKVAIAYVVGGWALSQGIAQVFPVFDVPNWIIRLIVLLIIIGFPVALILTWAFEITPEGIRRTQDVDPAKPHSAGGAWIYVVIAGALLLIGLFVVGEYGFRAARSNAQPVSTKSIAVLPLANLSSDPGNEYFAVGIQDEIITRLAQVADLKVVSCSSTQRYKAEAQNLRQVASELGVTNILEGSVQKANDEVRVNVQLLNALTDSHLWADSFDRKLTDVFVVESEIAKTVADNLRAKLTGHELATLNARPTENAAAHDLYLKGRFFWNKRDTNDLKKALAYFQQAANEDPNYALAWSGIADVYVLLPLFGGANPEDAYPKAKEAANKAIALDSNLAEPHAALALIGNLFDFDFSMSMREFEKAIALNPNYATAHHWFGSSLLECIGDFDRSVTEMKLASGLDPLSVPINQDMGFAYYVAGRYPEAIAQYHKTLELDPNSYYSHGNLGEVLEVSGDLPGAISEYEKAATLDTDPYSLALLAHGEGLNGNRERALEILEQVKASPRYVPDYCMGLIYLGLGDKAQAMDWFEKSFAKRQPDMNTIRFDPLLKSLHGDPRFEALAEKILPARELKELTKK
jgi:TolB-like protein/tetratricopeptide (TPR) repeat protein